MKDLSAKQRLSKLYSDVPMNCEGEGNDGRHRTRVGDLPRMCVSGLRHCSTTCSGFDVLRRVDKRPGRCVSVGRAATRRRDPNTLSCCVLVLERAAVRPGDFWSGQRCGGGAAGRPEGNGWMCP